MAQVAAVQATLFVGMMTLYRNEQNVYGVYPSDLIKNLRDRSTPPKNFTPSGAGGTFHNKTAHATVTNRYANLPVQSFRMASGTALTNVSSVTLPYFAYATSVVKVVWPANSQVKITQDFQMPSNYSTTVKSQALKLIARCVGTTAPSMDSELRIVKGGAAISADINPTAAALASSQTAPEEVSLAVSYSTFAKGDILNLRIFPAPVTLTATELFGAFFRYTGDE